jgi:hypothetical protein
MKDEIKPKDVRSFIFEREIAEVYLLLDFLSGRADKNLSNAFKGAGMPPIEGTEPGQAAPTPTAPNGSDAAITQAWIGAICSIRWPPEAPDRRPASALATTLLLAKDHLNSAAAPANGLSIAFSLLVAGDDEYREERHARRRTAAAPGPAPGPGPEPGPAPADEPPPGPDDEAASRHSLARQGYPTLIKTATAFRRSATRINIFLVLWLAFTCFLSWHVAVGHAVVLRLDATEAARIALYKQIPGTEVTPERPPLGSTTEAATPSAVKTYCPSTDFERLRAATFDNPAQRRLCFELADNRFKYKVARENLADWLAIWAPFKGVAHLICGGRCLEENERVKSPTATNDQWAASLLEVLATAVLPLCYGFLGAGAAVVRGIWRRMRDSLLMPRDLRLAISQLALGAVIGACIGLFIAPGAGSAQEGAALFNGPVVLSASALSFIAGFGVEGVFQALESLIRRLFNVRESGKEAE